MVVDLPFGWISRLKRPLGADGAGTRALGADSVVGKSQVNLDRR
jgi:hypothetical protein